MNCRESSPNRVKSHTTKMDPASKNLSCAPNLDPHCSLLHAPDMQPKAGDDGRRACPNELHELKTQAKLHSPAAREPAAATAKNCQQGEAAHRPGGTRHETQLLLLKFLCTCGWGRHPRLCRVAIPASLLSLFLLGIVAAAVPLRPFAVWGLHATPLAQPKGLPPCLR